MKKSALCLLLCLLLALPCLSVAEQSRQVNRSCRIYFANGTELASRLNDGRLLTEVNGAEAVEHTFYIDPNGQTVDAVCVQYGEHILPYVVQAQDAQGLAGKGGNGTHERDLAVQGLARIAVEQGGHMQGAADDEGRDRGIPGRVAAGLEGGAQATGREGGGIGLAADEHLAREFVDDAAFAGGGQEGVVLFGRQAGHGLEPVGVVRGALADGPVLHGAGHGIRDVRVKAFAAGDGGLQHAEHGLGQTLLQDVEGEDVTTEDGVDIGGRGLVVRMALGDLPDGISSSIHGETPWISFFRRAGKERVTPFTAA